MKYVDEAARQERLQNMLAFAEQVNRETFPCKVTVHPPGYIIDDRIREMEAEEEAAFQRKMEEIRQRRAQEAERRWQIFHLQETRRQAGLRMSQFMVFLTRGLLASQPELKREN